MSKRMPWKSKITTVRKNELITHGFNQRAIIREFSYEEMVYFLLFGKRPEVSAREILRAVIVAYISHGITGQSTLAVMQAADCRSNFLSALTAGFLVGSGDFHQGALQGAMVEITNFAAMAENLREAFIISRIEKGERILGYGHRFHSRDPRAEELMSLCEELEFGGRHVNAARSIEKVLLRERGIAMNLGAAAAGILLDLGFDSHIAPLIIVVGRSPMYAAAYLERLSQGKDKFQKIEISDLLESK